MKIIGTQQEKFKLLLDADFYNRGDIIENEGGYYELLDRSLKAFYQFEYTVLFPAMVGEELEIAVNHFKFLTKYQEFLNLF